MLTSADGTIPCAGVAAAGAAAGAAAVGRPSALTGAGSAAGCGRLTDAVAVGAVGAAGATAVAGEVICENVEESPWSNSGALAGSRNDSPGTLGIAGGAGAGSAMAGALRASAAPSAPA